MPVAVKTYKVPDEDTEEQDMDAARLGRLFDRAEQNAQRQLACAHNNVLWIFGSCRALLRRRKGLLQWNCGTTLQHIHVFARRLIEVNVLHDPYAFALRGLDDSLKLVMPLITAGLPHVASSAAHPSLR
eukprot:499130-Amphidinium_carterae.1